MIRALLLCFGLLCASPYVLAEACIINGHNQKIEIQICQHNGNIPDDMFRNSFCQPQLSEMETEVTFLEQCPTGAFGVCRDAHVGGVPMSQDIYYYGVATDARYLRPACGQQSLGRWEDLSPNPSPQP